MALKALVGLFICFMVSGVHAAVNENAVNHYFKQKQMAKVVEIYDQNKKDPVYGTSRNITIKTAYALGKAKRHSESARLQVRFIQKHYRKQNKELLRAVKKDEEVDPDDYPKALKILYWNIFQNYGKAILAVKESSKAQQTYLKNFQLMKSFLEQLEFREGLSEKLNDKVLAHLKYQEDSKYRFAGALTIDYVSWQSKGTLSYSGGTNDLIITNRGLCIGGELGFENNFYRYLLDGCVVLAGGNVQGKETAPVYKQSNVAANGLKFSVGWVKVLSEQRAEVGIKLPVMLSSQSLTEPPQGHAGCGPEGCKVEQPSAVNVMAVLHGKWHLGKFFFQTDFGKQLNEDSAIWSLGAGYKF